MDSLFEALYDYAVKHRCDIYLVEDEEERQKAEDAVCSGRASPSAWS